MSLDTRQEDSNAPIELTNAQLRRVSDAYHKIAGPHTSVPVSFAVTLPSVDALSLSQSNGQFDAVLSPGVDSAFSLTINHADAGLPSLSSEDIEAVVASLEELASLDVWNEVVLFS